MICVSLSQEIHSSYRFPMYKAFPCSEYYQQLRLLSLHPLFLRIIPFVPRYLLPRQQQISQVPGISIFHTCCASKPRRCAPILAIVDGSFCLPAAKYCRPPRVRSYEANYFTFVTARMSLCLRLVQWVAPLNSKLDSGCGGSTACPGRNYTF